MNTEHVMVPDRFRGPPRSGNGGYAGGVFAALLQAPERTPVEVTLRAPVPLDTPMTVTRNDNGVDIFLADQLIAEVRQAASLELRMPNPPGFEDALSRRPESLSLQVREGSPFPGGRGMHPICFCCGADHPDGLNVFAARMDENQVAAAWTTDQRWEDETGSIPPAYLWTALDCPGQVAYAVEGIRTGLLGRITANIYCPAPAGEDYVVTAWRERIEGKKHFAGTAIFDRTGTLIASALSIWIGRSH